MLIQGSNNPIVIKFDRSVDTIPVLVVSLWDKLSPGIEPLKAWEREDMTIDGDTAICPNSESETVSMPNDGLILEAKGLDSNRNTVFWDRCEVDVLKRHDRVIRLTQI